MANLLKAIFKNAGEPNEDGFYSEEQLRKILVESPDAFFYLRHKSYDYMDYYGKEEIDKPENVALQMLFALGRISIKRFVNFFYKHKKHCSAWLGYCKNKYEVYEEVKSHIMDNFISFYNLICKNPDEKWLYMESAYTKIQRYKSDEDDVAIIDYLLVADSGSSQL